MEKFIDIKGFENKFQISESGIVKRIGYKSKNRHGEYFLNEFISPKDDK